MWHHSSIYQPGLENMEAFPRRFCKIVSAWYLLGAIRELEGCATHICVTRDMGSVFHNAYMIPGPGELRTVLRPKYPWSKLRIFKQIRIVWANSEWVYSRNTESYNRYILTHIYMSLIATLMSTNRKHRLLCVNPHLYVVWGYVWNKNIDI